MLINRTPEWQFNYIGVPSPTSAGVFT